MWRIPLTRLASRSDLSPLAGRGKERACRRRRRTLRNQPQPQILRHVGVLILIHQDELEPLLILPQHVGLLAEQPDVLQEQVAEVGGVQRLEPILIRRIELLAAAVGEARRLAGRHHVRRQAAVLPVVDEASQYTRGPPLLVDALGVEQLLDQPDLVGDVEDGEVALQPDQLGVAAQDLDADGVEGAEPRHALDHLADVFADPLLHLARRLVGEGDGEDFGGPRPAQAQDVRDAGGEDAGLAGSGAGQHQHRAVQRLDRELLLGVQPGEIRGAGPCGHRTRGNAARRRGGRRRCGEGIAFDGLSQDRACPWESWTENGTRSVDLRGLVFPSPAQRERGRGYFSSSALTGSQSGPGG